MTDLDYVIIEGRLKRGWRLGILRTELRGFESEFYHDTETVQHGYNTPDRRIVTEERFNRLLDENKIKALPPDPHTPSNGWVIWVAE